MRKLLYAISLGMLFTACTSISTESLSNETADNAVDFISQEEADALSYSDTMTCRLTKYAFLDSLSIQSTQPH